MPQVVDHLLHLCLRMLHGIRVLHHILVEIVDAGINDGNGHTFAGIAGLTHTPGLQHIGHILGGVHFDLILHRFCDGHHTGQLFQLFHIAPANVVSNHIDQAGRAMDGLQPKLFPDSLNGGLWPFKAAVSADFRASVEAVEATS